MKVQLSENVVRTAYQVTSQNTRRVLLPHETNYLPTPRLFGPDGKELPRAAADENIYYFNWDESIALTGTDGYQALLETAQWMGPEPEDEWPDESNEVCQKLCSQCGAALKVEVRIQRRGNERRETVSVTYPCGCKQGAAALAKPKLRVLEGGKAKESAQEDDDKKDIANGQ